MTLREWARALQEAMLREMRPHFLRVLRGRCQLCAWSAIGQRDYGLPPLEHDCHYTWPAGGRRAGLQQGRYVAMAMALLLWGVPAVPAAERPNILLVSLDTVGAEYLEPGIAPTVARLGAEGLDFRRAYATATLTHLSHGSIMTGRLPAHHQLLTIKSELVGPTLAEVLHAAGYHTAAITENAFVAGAFGFARGFDTYDDGPRTKLDDVGNAAETFTRARAWLDAHGAEAPWFLFVHTYEAHAPYRLRDAAARALAVARLQVWQERLAAPQATLAATYQAGIGTLDRELDGFLGAVRAVWPSLLLIVLSDHGEGCGQHTAMGHGATLYNTALHVPLLLVWPGQLPAREVAEPVSLADVLPTLLALLDLPIPDGVDGRALVAARDGGLTSRPVVSQSFRVSGYGGTDATKVQTAAWALIRYHERDITELYALPDDPGERVNRAQDRPMIVKSLLGMLP